ncbi:MAG: hypothetical protein WC525_07660 [Candidatus Thermoplasmatota archaeon]
MGKKPLIVIILCLILLSIIAVPTQSVSKTIDYEENTESLSSNGDIYFFTFAFVKGEYENCWKHTSYFRLWNSDYWIKSIDVLGYTAWDHQFYSVKAFNVEGSLRIGFIGQHHCCIFAWGFSGVTVDT